MTSPVGPPEVHDLPVQEILPDLRAALRERTGAVVVAPPGAGKTTLVPLALLDEPWRGDAKILVLEPRRLAARAAARRMADLLGEDDAGGTVGYRVRMETRVSGRTRIEVVTEGILTRMLQSDPTLPGVGAVLFDEFHERSIHADLGMALALQSRGLFRDDLRILAMSATIDAEPVAVLLGEGRGADGREGPAGEGGPGNPGSSGDPGDQTVGSAPPDPAPVLTSEGRTYPVETRFRDRPVEGWIEPAVAAAVREAAEREEGDILVFLPGAGEIRRTADRLADGALPENVTVHPLFGSLSRSEQDRAIRTSPPGARKVVLATSIAETSLTIEGVRVVIDSGLMRVPRFHAGTGMTRLETVRVTRDSADQRRGRAGRVAPGVCYRLWTAGEDRGLVPRRTPELLGADLAPLALELAVWGAGPDELRWLDPPPETSYAQAIELLEELEAIEPRGGGGDGDATDRDRAEDLRTDACAVTAHGRQMASIGMHPRLAHLVLRGRELGLETLAVELAALLNGRDILRAEGRLPDADLRLRAEAVRVAREGGRARVGTIRGQRVDRRGLSRVLREVKHVRRSLPGSGGTRRGRHPRDRTKAPGAGSEVPDLGGATEPDDANPLDHVGLLTALAYPDRIGQRREGSRGRYRLRSGRGARFTEVQPLASSEWIVAPEVDGRGRDARIFRAAPLSLAEIEEHFAGQIEEIEEVVWDADAERVRARGRRMLGALVLGEAPLVDPAPHLVARALVEGVRQRGLDALPWSKETRQLRERLDFLHHVDPERWPSSSEADLEDELEEWLQPFLAGIRSFSGLDRVDLRQALLARVDREVRHRLDALAPTHLDVPSGSSIRIDYSRPEAPALAVRLQEVFGMTDTPRIGGGRVPLTMKLLSPAHRPVQVTQDLGSFWEDAYFEVRKEMRGRYPKHPWPEDPLAADATRRTKRRR